MWSSPFGSLVGVGCSSCMGSFLLFDKCLLEALQILVCTSTLAWGVNLPAHLVVIKVEPYLIKCIDPN